MSSYRISCGGVNQILRTKLTVNTDFKGDFLLGFKIIKIFQKLIRILNHEQTVNNQGDF